MPAIAVNQPFPLFSDQNGSLLNDAYIYFGVENLEPIANPITVYIDEALTVTVAQPIRTIGGYPVSGGTPQKLYVGQNYSIKILDKNGALVYSSLSNVVFVQSDDVQYTQSGTGGATLSLQNTLEALEGSIQYDAQRYRMKVRTAITSFPVPCVRPTNSNSVIALDVCPNGAPADFETNGKAWIDVCDTDVQTGNPQIASARVGITSSQVEFGSKGFNGATAKPVSFIFNNSVVAQYDSNFNFNFGELVSANVIRTLTVANTNTGTGASAAVELKTTVSGDNAYFRNFSAAFSLDGGRYANAVQIGASDNKKLHLEGSGGILFNLGYPNSTQERARLTTQGFFKFSNTGGYGNAAGLGDTSATSDFWFQSNVAGRNVAALNTSTSSAVANYSSFLATGSAGAHYKGLVNAVEVFRVLANGNVENTNNSYGAISDVKLKENIVDTTPKLNDILRVRVVNYNLKNSPSQKQIGVIAQELEDIFPGLVSESKDIDESGNESDETTKSVKYSVFVPILIKAIQEQNVLINELQKRILILESKFQ